MTLKEEDLFITMLERIKIKNNLELAIELGNFFINLRYPDFHRKTTFVSFYDPNEYAFYNGNIKVDNMIINLGVQPAVQLTDNDCRYYSDRQAAEEI